MLEDVSWSPKSWGQQVFSAEKKRKGNAIGHWSS